MSLNYEPAHLKQSENKLAELFDKKEKTVLFVSTGKDMGDATGQYAETNRLLAQLKEEGKIKDYASAGQFLIPEEVQEARLKQWHNYWTPEKKARLRETIRTEAARYHFVNMHSSRFSNGSTVRSSLWTTRMKSLPGF